MGKYNFDAKTYPPATGGARQDYITPGIHRLRVTDYSDSPSNAGKPMNTFTFEVISGPEKGKKIRDYFVIPPKVTTKASGFPLQRLNALIIAATSPKKKTGTINLKDLVTKTCAAEIVDERQEEQKRDGQTYPARTVSKIFAYLDPAAEEEREGNSLEDDEWGDEEDEDEEDDDDEDEDEEDEDEEEEEPVKPAKKAKKGATKKAKKAAKKPAKKSSKKVEVEDDDDDEFDDDDDDEEDDD